jgi:aryl-alcohol dehydrogenase-like predicted oxidoreductase
MEYGQLPGIDKPISRIVQGTVMISTDTLDDSFALLDAVFEGGCTTFDTAHGYGSGKVERALGQWIESRGIRDQVVILTKGAHHNQDRKRVTPHDITSDLYDSLARLRTGYIDLYILHRDDPEAPVGPIVEALNTFYEEGLVHAFGGSNWTTGRIQQANDYAASHGLKPFIASSPNFSLADQYEPPWPDCISISGAQGEAARAWYAESNMALFTWSSLAGGFFSGRFERDNLDTFDSYADKLVVQSYCGEENFKRLDRVQQLAAEKSLTIPQIATAYVLSYPLNIFALIGSHTPEEFQANHRAASLKLTPDEMAWLELRSDSR